MDLTGNTIFISGGGSGIGLAFAKRFIERGNTVIICGRRAEVLADVKQQHPEIQTHVCDLAEPSAREKMAEWLITEFPDLNIVVNNAGIQRSVDLTQEGDFSRVHTEIAINLEAPIHLSRLLYAQLAGQEKAAILNVTSGLSFMPLVNVPVYCATKAALHSFTLSLRRQLEETSVEVIEIIPPAVDTDLQAPGLHTFGVNVDEFADDIFLGLERGQQEVAYGTALQASRASREQLDAIFDRMNGSLSSPSHRAPVENVPHLHAS
ncbi:MAG: SDR family oxidoreductase [Pyrinomonadaceae bacterium]